MQSIEYGYNIKQETIEEKKNNIYNKKIKCNRYKGKFEWKQINIIIIYGLIFLKKFGNIIFVKKNLLM